MHKVAFEVGHSWCRCSLFENCHVCILECFRKLGSEHLCYYQLEFWGNKNWAHWRNVRQMVCSKLWWFLSCILGLIPDEGIGRPKRLCPKVCKMCQVRWEHACYAHTGDLVLAAAAAPYDAPQEMHLSCTVPSKHVEVYFPVWASKKGWMAYNEMTWHSRPEVWWWRPPGGWGDRHQVSPAQAHWPRSV